jgi:DNA-binding GntR family transcriptional regulator
MAVISASSFVRAARTPHKTQHNRDREKTTAMVLQNDPSLSSRSTGGVYWHIRQKILRNEIPPASKINIDDLARELKVSPTPVREALKQLQGDNLVIQEVRRGYQTTPLLDSDELRDLFEFRLLLEPWAAHAAAQDRLSNPGHDLENLIDGLNELSEGYGDVRFELVEHDTRFHDLIFLGARNPVLRKAYSQTHCHLHAFRLYPSDHTGALTVQEHRKIANAIRARDPEGAAEAMRDHLSNAYLRFAEGYKNFPGASPQASTLRGTESVRLSL